MDRRALLESKRAKLEELKRQRLEREREFQREISTDSLSPDGLVDSIVKDVLVNKNTTEHRRVSAVMDESVEVQVATEEVPAKPQTAAKPRPASAAIMYDKAVDAEETENSDKLADVKKDERKSLAEMKTALEEDLRRKYEAELQQKLEELELNQKQQIEKSNRAIFSLFETPRDPIAKNTDKDSKYAQPVLAEAKSETLTLANGQFSSTSKDFVSDIITLDNSFKSTRAVTSLDWSPHYPELFLASYAVPDKPTVSGPRGVIVVWNRATQKREFTLLSFGELTMARFCRKHANRIVAGGKDGRLHLWQLDSATRYPVASSAVPTHTDRISPVVGVHEASNSMISITSKGLVSVFSLDLMNKINEEVLEMPGNASYMITATYIDTQQTVLGLSTGEIYSRVQQQVDEIVKLRSPAKMHARLPVTSLDFAEGSVLAGSVDYKLKLIRRGKPPQEMFVPYLIADARFGRDASRFVTVGFDGKLDFWDTKKQPLDPVQSLQLHSEDTLNRAVWSTDREYLACGGLAGKVYVMKLEGST